MQEQNVNEKEPMNDIKFADGSVPVAVAARVYGKEAHWVRAGIIVGWLPIGTATRKGQVVKTIKEMDSRYGRINYYISPQKLYKETGQIWKEVKERSCSDGNNGYCSKNIGISVWRVITI